MNKYQKLVQQEFLNNEEEVIKKLEMIYAKSLNDLTKKSLELQNRIDNLGGILDITEDEAERLIVKSMIQSKIYQKNFQDALKKQVGAILDTMQVEEFSTVADYLIQCYEDGYVGTMYDMQAQGVPLMMPIDQEAMVMAVQTDSKISEGLYTRLGEDIAALKKKITAEVSRGISSGLTYGQMAQALAAYTNIGLNNAKRITRTEGHRIQCQSTMNACYDAQERGADIVKQWDSTLDRRTRKSHQKVDGEIRELDEAFSNGLMMPSDPSGKASEVINCRCALLQRARWTLEGGLTKRNNFAKELMVFDSEKSYQTFKKDFFSKENIQYMNYVEKLEARYGTKDFNKLLASMTDREYDHFSQLAAATPVFK